MLYFRQLGSWSGLELNSEGDAGEFTENDDDRVEVAGDDWKIR